MDILLLSRGHIGTRHDTDCLGEIKALPTWAISFILSKCTVKTSIAYAYEDHFCLEPEAGEVGEGEHHFVEEDKWVDSCQAEAVASQQIREGVEERANGGSQVSS
jgi:hypothetical protein